MTDTELDEFVKHAEKCIHSDEWWLHDFFDSAAQVGQELQALRRQQPRPITNGSK